MQADMQVRPYGCAITYQQGFTLLELLITLSILSILMFVAIPGLNQWVADGKVAETSHRLRAALALAREEAIRRGYRVTLCVSTDAQQCAGGARNGWYDWPQVLLFKDENQDRLLAGNKDELIRSLSLLRGGQVIWNRGQSTVYEADGSLLGGSNGSFYIFDPQAVAEGSKLVLQMSGRARQATLSSSEIAKIDQYLGH